MKRGSCRSGWGTAFSIASRSTLSETIGCGDGTGLDFAEYAKRHGARPSPPLPEIENGSAEDARRPLPQNTQKHLLCRKADREGAAQDGEGGELAGAKGRKREAPRRDAGPRRAARAS